MFGIVDAKAQPANARGVCFFRPGRHSFDRALCAGEARPDERGSVRQVSAHALGGGLALRCCRGN